MERNERGTPRGSFRGGSAAFSPEEERAGSRAAEARENDGEGEILLGAEAEARDLELPSPTQYFVR
jgi:hypothetical protein